MLDRDPDASGLGVHAGAELRGVLVRLGAGEGVKAAGNVLGIRVAGSS